MNLKCPNCHRSAAPGDRFCQGCGTPLAATSVGGRTVVLPQSRVGAFSPEQVKTIVQRVQKTLGGATALAPAGTMVLGDPNQRELIVLVMDRSDSMGDPFDPGVIKLEAAVRAAINLILNKAQMDPQDEIALVAFNSRAKVLQGFYPIRTHKQDMIRILQGLSPDNGTDIDEGMQSARDLFDWRRSEVIRRMVVLTDGEGGEPLGTAKELKSRGVVIDVIGIGDCPDNVNENLLRQVASVVGGQLRYRFIKNSQTLVAHYTQLANKTATA